jgi:hypothetical protein
VTGLYKKFSGYLNYFRYFNYFNYVPKENTKLSQSNLQLAIELKTISKAESFKCYLGGLTLLYLLTLADKKKSVFGYKMTSYMLGSGILILSSLYYVNKPILDIMNIIFNKESEFLYDKMKRETAGFNSKVIMVY